MLKLEIDVEPDEHGVYDGREVAAKLIGMAMNLIVPYAGNCEICTLDLSQDIYFFRVDLFRCHFNKESSGVLLHENASEEGKAAHLKAAEASTEEMIQGMEYRNEHECERKRKAGTNKIVTFPGKARRKRAEPSDEDLPF